MAANVAVAQDPAGNLEPRTSHERIDGIVALIMAIGRALVVQEEPQPSYQILSFDLLDSSSAAVAQTPVSIFKPIPPPA